MQGVCMYGTIFYFFFVVVVVDFGFFLYRL